MTWRFAQEDLPIPHDPFAGGHASKRVPTGSPEAFDNGYDVYPLTNQQTPAFLITCVERCEHRNCWLYCSGW